MGTNMLPDPVLSVALSVRQRTCALLLGSGVSQAAEVPTGWDVVLLLIAALARSRGADPGDDVAAWYEQEFGSPPTYDAVLGALAPSPGDRAALLRPYFEPTEEERERGAKLPTPAHRAIAALVAMGYVKAIITTNFDRLMERAIEEVGISPVVVNSAAAAKGSAPLHQVPCLVVKVHGDYLDVVTRNTRQELARYEKQLDRLLDRVLEDYGLVIAGWSAGWDVALKAAVLRSPNRRYATYWITRSDPTDEASRLIAHRQATVVRVNSADEFFTSLLEKVRGLDALSAPHPLSVATAVAAVKRMIPRAEDRIRLADLVSSVTQDAIQQTRADRFPTGDPPRGEWQQAFQERLRAYQGATMVAQHVAATGAYWGLPTQAFLWRQMIEALASAREDANGQYPWLELLLYPSLLTWYAFGIAAVANDQYESLQAVSEARLRTWHSDDLRARELNAWTVFRTPQDGSWFGRQRNSIGGPSFWLEDVLRDPLRPLIPNDTDYERAFDRWEYLLSLLAASERPSDPRGPIGRFHWRRVNNRGDRVVEVINAELDAVGDQWPPLRAGLFDMDANDFATLKAAMDENMRRASVAYY